MENKSYTATIEVTKSAHEVFNCVNYVSQWWAKSAEEALSRQQTNFEGNSKNLNDEFTITSGDRHYSKQKLIEVIPDQKIVWQVTDCKINWLKKDKTEWLNTKMIFEITPGTTKTMLKFTHEGLEPVMECYDNCVKGWDFLIKDRLFNFITKN